MIRKISAPAGSVDEGDWWKVCSYDASTGEITVYNKIITGDEITDLYYNSDDEDDSDSDTVKEYKTGIEKLITGVTSSMDSTLSANIYEDTYSSYVMTKAHIDLESTSGKKWNEIKDSLTFQGLAQDDTVKYIYKNNEKALCHK